MCGIAGIYSREAAPLGRVVAAMTEALRHRGPDGCGHVRLPVGEAAPGPVTADIDERPGRMFFGHRRLSIIDPQGTVQPLANEDGSVWVVFNGEIYNYPELRTELAAQGHVLREAGDTEVLVHLWEAHREGMLERLVGMFAFALFDTRRDTLFLARDRFGQKPLYYWQRGAMTAFASELQALRCIPGFPAERIDPTAAGQYFRYGYVPGPRTIHPGVRSLPPGSFLLVEGGRASLGSYWRPRVTGSARNIPLEAVQERLDEAVRLRLRSDVPLGAFLSGGIDSTLIVASMARQLPSPVDTFTIATGHAWCDESEAARLASRHLGCNHFEEPVQPDFVAISQRLARHYGQPFADYSSVPTYLVSRTARRRVPSVPM